MLKIDHVTKQYEGLVALEEVTFNVDDGEIVGLIGPNGAGKTTLFNIISNVTTPTSGTVRHNGEALTGIPTYSVAEHGVIRTFQVSRTLYTLPVIDNFLVAPLNQKGETLVNTFVNYEDVKAEEKTYESKAKDILETLELSHERDTYARNLSGGQQQLLEIGRALMTDPDVILLDEPMAGVAPHLIPNVVEKIKKIRDERKTAFLIIEHNLDAIRELSDVIITLSNGRVVSEEQNKDPVKT